MDIGSLGILIIPQSEQASEVGREASDIVRRSKSVGGEDTRFTKMFTAGE